MQRRVEYRAPTCSLQITAEAKFHFRAVERRRLQVSAERLDVQNRKGMTGALHHVVQPLSQALLGREFVDAFDSRSLRHAGVIDEVTEWMREIAGRSIAAVCNHEMLEVGQRQLALDQQHAGVHAERAIAAERHDSPLRRTERNSSGEQ